jgi:hypothetical protein
LSSDLWMSTRELHNPGPRSTTSRIITAIPINVSTQNPTLSSRLRRGLLRGILL